MPSSRMFPIFCAPPARLESHLPPSVGSFYRSIVPSLCNAAIPILSDVDRLTDRQEGRERRLHPSA